MGGKKDGDLRFCNKKCLEKKILSQFANRLPVELLEQHIHAIHKGKCPKCKRNGPVDLHVSYRIWSIIYFTSWKKRQQVCCRFCGIKSRIGDIFYCTLFGWWGIPCGIIMTPVQILRNICGIISSPDPEKPSEGLRNYVRLELAAQLVQEDRRRKEQSNTSDIIPYDSN